MIQKYASPCHMRIRGKGGGDYYLNHEKCFPSQHVHAPSIRPVPHGHERRMVLIIVYQAVFHASSTITTSSRASALSTVRRTTSPPASFHRNTFDITQLTVCMYVCECWRLPRPEKRHSPNYKTDRACVHRFSPSFCCEIFLTRLGCFFCVQAFIVREFLFVVVNTKHYPTAHSVVRFNNNIQKRRRRKTIAK